jgi:hypothetical protein
MTTLPGEREQARRRIERVQWFLTVAAIVVVVVVYIAALSALNFLAQWRWDIQKMGSVRGNSSLETGACALSQGLGGVIPPNFVTMLPSKCDPRTLSATGPCQKT